MGGWVGWLVGVVRPRQGGRCRAEDEAVASQRLQHPDPANQKLRSSDFTNKTNLSMVANKASMTNWHLNAFKRTNSLKHFDQTLHIFVSRFQANQPKPT